MDKSYDEMIKSFEKLKAIVANENKEFPVSEKQALENAQQAFEKYLEAEMIYQEILVHPVRGDALENIKRYIQKDLCEQRIERLEQSIRYHEFE